MDTVSQSFRILTNLIAAGTLQSSPALDSITCVLLEFTAAIAKMKISDAQGLIIKVFLNPIKTINSFNLTATIASL